MLANGLYQILLAGKVAIDASGAQTGFPDHVLNCGLVEARARKACLGSPKNLLAPHRQRFGFYFRHWPLSQFISQSEPRVGLHQLYAATGDTVMMSSI